MIKLNNNCSLLNNEQHKTRPFLIDLNTVEVWMLLCVYNHVR